jgi:hypothetical protein
MATQAGRQRGRRTGGGGGAEGRRGGRTGGEGGGGAFKNIDVLDGLDDAPRAPVGAQRGVGRALPLDRCGVPPARPGVDAVPVPAAAAAIARVLACGRDAGGRGLGLGGPVEERGGLVIRASHRPAGAAGVGGTGITGHGRGGSEVPAVQRARHGAGHAAAAGVAAVACPAVSVLNFVIRTGVT